MSNKDRVQINFAEHFQKGFFCVSTAAFWAIFLQDGLNYGNLIALFI